jgi:hypothetical protein
MWGDHISAFTEQALRLASTSRAELTIVDIEQDIRNHQRLWVPETTASNRPIIGAMALGFSDLVPVMPNWEPVVENLLARTGDTLRRARIYVLDTMGYT